METAKRRYDSGQTIVIRRVDVEHVEAYARGHRDLRDYLMLRLPKKIGLRTHEIATLKIENIDFQSRSFRVLDSKKKRLYPLLLDILTLELIQELNPCQFYENKCINSVNNQSNREQVNICRQ